MDIRDFYSSLIELTPCWKVKTVESEPGSEEVNIYLVCGELARIQCPLCDRLCLVADRLPSRSWRHLDTCGKVTLLHAGLPVVDCPEHGAQHPRPPWGEADSATTRAFNQMVARMHQAMDDARKIARLMGMSQAQIRNILSHTALENGTGGLSSPGVQQRAPKTSSRPPTRQLSLFDQNDMTFVNQGIQAFRALDLDKAVELFHKHQAIYPKGYNITSRLEAAEFLQRGFGEASSEASERPARLCRLWDSFEDYLKSDNKGNDSFAAELKAIFFSRVLEAAEQCGPAAGPWLHPGSITLGYALLQAGRYEDAIRSLQSCIPGAPDNAAIYGYLGDAYRLRGDMKVARQCYREACFIDPAGIDWRHLVDEELKELKQDLMIVYDFHLELALAWLPSHARINGLFERRLLRLDDGLREMVDDYLALEKAMLKEKTPELEARLFFRGIILCENEESLRFIKKIDLIEVRRLMKHANPSLFADFLKTI